MNPSTVKCDTASTSLWARSKPPLKPVPLLQMLSSTALALFSCLSPSLVLWKKVEVNSLIPFSTPLSVVREWADEIGVKGDLVEICNDEKIVKKMMEEIQATAKSAGLSKLEIPNKVHIDGSFEAGWLPDTGLVTDAFKVFLNLLFHY